MNKINVVILLALIIVIALIEPSNAQYICDDSASIYKPTILGGKKTPEEILQQSKEKRSRARGLEIACSIPTFLDFVIERGVLVKKVCEANATGVAINIDRYASCDINKQMLAVPIHYNGKDNWAVTGFDGKPVFMDACFITLLTNPDYWCDGLPDEPTKYNTCGICSRQYASQIFKAKIGDKITTTTYYPSTSLMKCFTSKSGSHDNLQLTPTTGCVKGKGITYPRD